MLVDQLLFGYQDGHRQLIGSTPLNRDAESLLLGATDAAVTSAEDRLVTGLPLPSEKKYALSATWLAPEVDRPGAVWAHTLLIKFEDLAHVTQPAALFDHVRRPQQPDFNDYGQPIQIDPRLTRPVSADLKLMHQILATGTDKTRLPVVVYPDMKAAEQTLLALWGAQWPELRLSFSFRTREAIRIVPKSAYVAVAKRIRGMNRPTVAQPPSRPPASDELWLHGLKEDPLIRGGLHEFLLEFGPDESPDLQSFVFLGRLHGFVAEEDPNAVVAKLEDRHSGPQQARNLKSALFGSRAAKWWQVPEIGLLKVVLGSRRVSFEPQPLELVPRLRPLIRDGYVTEIVKARPRSGPKSIRKALLDALIHEATVTISLSVIRSDEKLGLDLLRAKSDLLQDRRLWKAMTADEAEAAMSNFELTNEIVVAAAKGGQFEALLNKMSFLQLLERLIRTRNLKLVRRAVEALHNREDGTDPASESRSNLLLAAADAYSGEHANLLGSLEESRDSPDEVWLRSAVFALRVAKNKDIKRTLEVVFGPLHNAITDDRLPRGLWKTLDQTLPRAHDPALRLRRFLITKAKEESWSAQDLERALRDSGPFIDQLRKEVDEEGYLEELVDSALKSLRS